MKKIIILVFCIVAILFTNHLISHKNVPSTLLLYNVEALASDDEHAGITWCVGTGSLDCPISHRKVEYIFGGYSLEVD